MLFPESFVYRMTHTQRLVMSVTHPPEMTRVALSYLLHGLRQLSSALRPRLSLTTPHSTSGLQGPSASAPAQLALRPLSTVTCKAVSACLSMIRLVFVQCGINTLTHSGLSSQVSSRSARSEDPRASLEHTVLYALSEFRAGMHMTVELLGCSVSLLSCRR